MEKGQMKGQSPSRGNTVAGIYASQAGRERG